jgi:hypothetical protein
VLAFPFIHYWLATRMATAIGTDEAARHHVSVYRVVSSVVPIIHPRSCYAPDMLHRQRVLMALILAVGAVTSACGGVNSSPTAPTSQNALNLTETWTGTTVQTGIALSGTMTVNGTAHSVTDWITTPFTRGECIR